MRASTRLMRRLPLGIAFCLLALLPGCSRFRHQHFDTVYVSARQTYLHDRVAAVSDRIAEVVNGQPLQVLEHGRRFLKVKTGKNEVGWIEERAVIDARTFASFMQLAEEHKQDPVAATATLRDDLYMHLLPGRETEHFYLLAGNTKVQLMERASVSKAANQAPPVLSAVKPAAPGEAPPPAHRKPLETRIPGLPEASPPDMEDWWLARDSQGHTGWLLGNRLDVDVPDEIAQYGEGQRFVGSWVLTRITDPASASQISEYLTVTAPLKAGLPFDFDEVRVFTWSVKHHRYETAFMLHPIQGFLPVNLATAATAKGNVPAFSFQIANGPNLTTDPATGITRPANSRTIHYEMIDTRVERIGPDLAPIPTMHLNNGEKKQKAERSANKKRK
jgi:hypothetical protein